MWCDGAVAVTVTVPCLAVCQAGAGERSARGEGAEAGPAEGAAEGAGQQR